MKLKRIQALFKKETGVTLIELVVVIVITGVLSVIFAPYFKVTTDTYTSVMQGKEAIQTSRIAMRRLVSELKRIPSPEDLEWGSSTNFQFDLPNQANIEYTYYSSTQQITRQTGNTGSEDIFLQGVQAFSVQYIERDGTAFSTISQGKNIASIEINLTVGDGTHNYTTRTLVSPRGLH